MGATLEKLLENISGYLWGVPMIVLLFGTHLYLTWKLGFIQRFTWRGILLSFRTNKEGAGDVSHFAALMTALAATIGTGNIVGVATAVAAGGPGAVFWMWLTGVFGIATKYAEAFLAVKYRVQKEDGSMAGGPMYVLERGLKAKWLATLFAIFTSIAAFGIGNMVQANSISHMLKEWLDLSPWISGTIITIVTGLVILGGIKSVAKVCSYFVPFMAILYIFGCLTIVIINWRNVPHAFYLILTTAFSGQAAVGGFLGVGIKEAMRFGIARGLFSNESGMGSAPIVAAAAQTSSPTRQALVSATGTFWDTVVICLLTGIVIVSSGDWQQGLQGAALTRTAFAHVPVFGTAILSLGLFTFVLSTIFGWEYYGEKSIEYLFGTKAIAPYRVAWVGAVMVGAVSSLSIIWTFADVFNALMAIPNLISLLLLASVVKKETQL